MPTEMNGVVVGIDTSSRGFHAVASTPIPMPGMAVPSRLGFCESKLDPQTRRHLTFSEAKDFFRTLPHGSTVAIEEPIIMTVNTETTMKLVMMAGAIEAAFWQAYPDATLWWVNVSTWRRDVLAPAKGQAPRDKAGWKALARAYVLAAGEFSEMEVAVMESEPDLWDAACVMEYGRQVAAAAR